MPAQSYFEKVILTLQAVLHSEQEAISQAARVLANAVAGDKRIFSFGASHSFIMTEEIVYRTGGLMLINPIYPQGMNLSVRPLTLTSALERLAGLGEDLLKASPIQSGDALIITSTSGRNAVTIDMAIAAKELGVSTIGIISKAYSSGVTSRHPSGKKLGDLCDIVIDNGVPYGDAVMSVAGLSQKIGPLSTVTGCTIVNAMVVEVIESLVSMGVSPPVFTSANLDGGEEKNARMLAENRHRIFYL